MKNDIDAIYPSWEMYLRSRSPQQLAKQENYLEEVVNTLSNNLSMVRDEIFFRKFQNSKD